MGTMGTTTRAATVPSPRHLEVTEGEAEEPGPGHVLVQIRYCGVCGTDVHAYAAPDMLPPAVFGHEWTGEVVATGDGVETVTSGDRVAAAVGPPCGRCTMCRSGHADHCDTAYAEANGVTPDAPPHGGFARTSPSRSGGSFESWTASATSRRR
jgi:(R,R)-butanediol dehydrogenase / meso-butanediol dehydrogenase / diacetyl reductase